MSFLKDNDPAIFNCVNDELKRQQENIELIASENIVSRAVLETMGSVLTNKYAEGYPAARWYNGCEHVDVAEQLAIDRAKELFGAEYANVQPHSGSQANMAVYMAALKEGDTVIALDLACGGHLTHGLKFNFSGRFYNVIPYKVDKDSEMLDYNEIEQLALEHKPKMIIAGASAYSQVIDFKRFREICDKVGAYLFVDMAHIAGLVATGLHPNPVEYAEFVTTTTHKTLRGPRGGLILARKEWERKLNSAIFPGIQGGPFMHIIAAKAVAFKEALSSDFKVYQQQVIDNAQAMANALTTKGFRIVSGGTENHLFMVDLRPKNATGKEAAEVLDRVKITVNKNLIPFDDQAPTITSGIRIGTPAVTTRGMKIEQMVQIADLIDQAIVNKNDETILDGVAKQVEQLTKAFPIYDSLSYA